MLWIGLAMAAVPHAAAAHGSAKLQPSAPSAQMKALVQSCDAHKFETMIDVTVDGIAKKSRVKLCGTEGQSDADWINTLKDAVAKTSANLRMPAAVRTQIVTALNAEIARLTSGASSSPTRTTALDGISALPPLPPAPSSPELPASRAVTADSSADTYSALPPIPSAAPPPVHVLAGAAGAAGAALPLLPKPKLSLTCFIPGETDDGPCADFERGTLVTVHADEDVPGGTSLRFVRSGDRRADVELAQLKRGKSESFALPEEVCRGASGGKLEIRIVRSVAAAGPDGEEVGSDGPYVLRC
jgi:hypothetical protein